MNQPTPHVYVPASMSKNASGHLTVAQASTACTPEYRLAEYTAAQQRLGNALNCRYQQYLDDGQPEITWPIIPPPTDTSTDHLICYLRNPIDLVLAWLDCLEAGGNVQQCIDNKHSDFLTAIANCPASS